jgi:MFS superfamily sulfate permease-like transporter
MTDPRFERALEEFLEAQRLSRRRFLGRAGGAAFAATGLSTLLAACGSVEGTQQKAADESKNKAAAVLGELLVELRQREVTVAFAEMKGPVKDRLRRYGLYDQVGDERFFPTVGTAVDGYLRATGVQWVDWEERPEPAP